VQCFFDEDTELWKFSSSIKLKELEKARLIKKNDALRQINLKVSQIVLRLKSKGLSLSPENVRVEYERPGDIGIPAKSILARYLEFIALIEKEREGEMSN
jgi:hypothetical protein